METKTVSLFLLITEEDQESLNLLQFIDGKLCELVGVKRTLFTILENINHVAGLCSYIDLELAKKRRNELQNGYEKEIMIFSLLITTETDVII